MKVFEYDNYKKFVIESLKNMPKRGHGQLLKIANLLNIHTTMVTHIFKGNSNLSVEQALKICTFLGLNDLETEYFILLVQLERASAENSRIFFKKQMAVLKERAMNLKERLPAKKILDEKSQALFYSEWYYSAIHLLVAISEDANPKMMAEKFSLPIKTVHRVIEFLLQTGLCKEVDGRLVIGESQTYLDRDSALITRHHVNWRLKAMEQLPAISNEELVFTNPIALSKKDFLKIREEIVQLLERFRKIADPSPSEEICCLNIDWVKII